jgi:subtilisin-like proprotein convertase family protein
MDQIKLRRGGKEIILTKVQNEFALRLKQGRAKDEKMLEACCGTPMTELRHIDSVAPANMEVFSMTDTKKLEKTMSGLRKASASDVVSHMYKLDDTARSTVIPTGTLTIQFKSDVSNKEREHILAEFGLEIVEELDYIPHGFTVALTPVSQENPLKICAKLQSMNQVEIAEPDLSFQTELKHVPTDALYRDQWHLNNLGDQVGLEAGADVKAQQAWELSRGSREITVCVMDDGFDLTHPDFNQPDKIRAARDFGQGDFEPNPVFAEDNHGTACAGIAIAEENGTGVVGLAPRCSFMPVRTNSWLDDQSVVNLFQYAIDNDADVISCSWTAAAWNFPLSTKISAIIHKAATQGRKNKKGCVILFAAGNEDRPLDGEKDGQISHQGFGLHPDVIAVAASNSLDQRASYSNYGPQLAICAPSSGSPGRRVVTTDRRGTLGYNAGDYTYTFGGTSSSTPLAAGLAGLILSANPELTAAEVKQVMMQTADKISPNVGNYDNNGHSELFGHGRINARAAVEMALGLNSEQKLPQVLFMEHRVDKPIPDLDEMTDKIVFPLNVNIQQMEVSMDIQHTWRGDLRVSLISPQNNEIVLVDRTGGSADNIIETFRSSDDAALFESLLQTSANGEWRLRVIDNAGEDVGVLRKWSLAINYVE